MSSPLSKYQYGKCFGNWLVSDPECSKCALSDKCEKKTKLKIEESDKDGEENVVTETRNNVSAPMDYLLKSLSGQFDYERSEKDKAILHKFSQNGKLIIAVVIGAYGKIKIISVRKNTQKIFGNIESIEEAEGILAEML